MNKAKALLDSLMGPSRDVSLKCRTGEDFKEDTICKHYIVGFCPTSVLGKNCEFLPACKKVHSIALKEEFERHAQVEKYRKEYEVAFARKLEDICSEADTRGSREKRKVRPRESIVKIPEHLKLKMQAYEESRKEKLKEAEDKGSEGDVAGSLDAVKSAEQCQKDIDGIVKAHTNEFPGEEVCGACGVRYLVGRMGEVRGYERYREGDVWEEDHLAGKVHKGYVEIRQKLAELRDKNRQRQEQEKQDKNDDRNHHSNKDDKTSSKDVDRDRGRDGDPGRDKDRVRDRDRDRDRDRARDPDRKKDREVKDVRGRSRSRSRGRQARGGDRRTRSEEKRRGRSRSRDRSRGKR